MNLWLLMVLIGLITFSFRSSLILTAGRIALPKTFERGLRYVPPAVLMALIVPQFLTLDGQLAIAPTNERLIAGLIAGTVAWFTKSMLATIATGMLALWLLQYLLS